jgi:methionyl-tRNA formyltransferase
MDVLGVLTQPDKPAGRGHKLQPPAVKAHLLEHAPLIPVFQPKSLRKDAERIQWLRDQAPDVLVTIAFGQILSQEVLDIPKLGTVNVHASLLPELRGPNPIQWAILQGKTETGLTTMLTDIGVDTGAMLLKHSVPIGPDTTALELTQELSASAGPLLLETLRQLRAGAISPQPQPHDRATHAPKLSPEDAQIDWSLPAGQLHNRIRGQQPWPGAYTFLGGERFKITLTRWSEGLNSETNLKNEAPGSILDIMKEGILVQTGQGALEILRVQPAGKREMSARDWANGFLKNKPWPAFGETSTQGPVPHSVSS